MSKIVSELGIDIYTESFGDPNHPPVLLIMGADLQGIYWYDEFCLKLAAKKFLVIRYDNRGAGKSSEVDYDKNPYNIMDLTIDAVNIIEDYGFKKAHIVGISMGGEVAQFIGAYYPKKATTLTLISTSSSFKQLFQPNDANSENELSAPTKEYREFVSDPKYLKKSAAENLEDTLHTMRLLEGNYNFDANFHQDLIEKSLLRSLKDPYYSQVKAMQDSYHLHEEALGKIKTPTLIIQGGLDPIFPQSDHAESLTSAIPGSRSVIIENMGHLINPIFNDKMVELLAEHFCAYSLASDAG